MLIWILSHLYLFLYPANGGGGGGHYKRRRNGSVVSGTKLFSIQHRNMVLKSREVICEKVPGIMEMVKKNQNFTVQS